MQVQAFQVPPEHASAAVQRLQNAITSVVLALPTVLRAARNQVLHYLTREAAKTLQAAGIADSRAAWLAGNWLGGCELSLIGGD